jgi:hypothetical protein
MIIDARALMRMLFVEFNKLRFHSLNAFYGAAKLVEVGVA